MVNRRRWSGLLQLSMSSGGGGAEDVWSLSASVSRLQLSYCRLLTYTSVTQRSLSLLACLHARRSNTLHTDRHVTVTAVLHIMRRYANARLLAPSEMKMQSIAGDWMAMETVMVPPLHPTKRHELRGEARGRVPEKNQFRLEEAGWFTFREYCQWFHGHDILQRSCSGCV